MKNAMEDMRSGWCHVGEVGLPADSRERTITLAYNSEVPRVGEYLAVPGPADKPVATELLRVIAADEQAITVERGAGKGGAIHPIPAGAAIRILGDWIQGLNR